MRLVHPVVNHSFPSRGSVVQPWKETGTPRSDIGFEKKKSGMCGYSTYYGEQSLKREPLCARLLMLARSTDGSRVGLSTLATLGKDRTENIDHPSHQRSRKRKREIGRGRHISHISSTAFSEKPDATVKLYTTHRIRSAQSQK